jgi:hypothetical protein
MRNQPNYAVVDADKPCNCDRAHARIVNAFTRAGRKGEAPTVAGYTVGCLNCGAAWKADASYYRGVRALPWAIPGDQRRMLFARMRRRSDLVPVADQ